LPAVNVVPANTRTAVDLRPFGNRNISNPMTAS
jgi:hypothetical protein